MARRTRAGIGRRVLVVDDNVDAAQTTERLLKAWGHDVHAVFNGLSAIELVRSFHPDVILLDIGMPGMSDYEVARSIRALPDTERVMIFALTGYGQAETKPPDPMMLSKIIQSPETYSWSD